MGSKKRLPFLPKKQTPYSKNKPWSTIAKRFLRKLCIRFSAGFLAHGSSTLAAPSHAWHNGIAARLPVYSDRIAQVFHLIPFYPCGWCFRLALKTQIFFFRLYCPPPRGICGGQATKKQNRLGSSSNHVLFKYLALIF